MRPLRTEGGLTMKGEKMGVVRGVYSNVMGKKNKRVYF